MAGDQPSGALIGRHAFDGGHASGTDDKTGSPLALRRSVDARFITENFAPGHHRPYPYRGQ